MKTPLKISYSVPPLSSPILPTYHTHISISSSCSPFNGFSTAYSVTPYLQGHPGRLAVKTADSEAWEQLDPPSDDEKNKCCGIVFDGGVTVIQIGKATRGTRRVKFIVESPPTVSQDTSCNGRPWIIEAIFF